MAKSQRLRLHEVQAVYRLVADCRERGFDAQEWRQHLAEGLLRIAHVRVCTVSESVGNFRDRLQKTTQLLGAGFDAETVTYFDRYKQDAMMFQDPATLVMARLPKLQATFKPEDFVGQEDYFSTVLHNEYYRPARCDFSLASYYFQPCSGSQNYIVLFRSADMQRFDSHDQRLLDLLHKELGPLLGGPLARALDPGLSELPRRVRQTLEALLEGDSEKQAALRLGIRQQTVHDYVKTLYRHFGVSSRAELLALFLRRWRGRSGGSDQS